MDALVNNCLKPVASTLPLATDEIKKLHGKRFFFKLDAMHAFYLVEARQGRDKKVEVVAILVFNTKIVND